MNPLILHLALSAAPIMAALPTQYEAVGVPAGAPRTRFPERRYWLSSQAWWRPAGETGVGQHTHCEAAVPIGQTVSGALSLDVRIQLHGQPQGNRVNKFRIIDDRGTRVHEQAVDIRPDSDGNADVWLRDVLIETWKQFNGRREYRFTANMTTREDGNRQYQSTGWVWWVRNPTGGLDINARNERFHESRGWYSAPFNYANARLASLFPFAPVSGTYTFDVSLAPGSGGAAVTEHSIHIDPSFHDGNEGTVVKRGTGPYRGPVSIDTRTLTNGVHRLVLIAHAERSEGRNSGVLSIPIVVAN